MPWGITLVPPAVLKGEPRSGMSENPRQQNQVGPEVCSGGGRVQKNGKAKVESELCPKPHGADHPVAHPAPRVESYPLPLGHHRMKQWRNLRPGRQPSEMPWSLPSPPCPGRIRCRKRKNRKDIPLQKAAPT